MKIEEYRVERIEDEHLGIDIERGIIYLRGDVVEPWCATFLCPCGCSNENHEAWIDLILLKDGKHPRWDYELHSDGAVTFSPSILRMMFCKSHFFIRRNKVFWA